MSKIIDEKEFKELLDKKEEMIIDFYADWCGPCKRLSPIMDEVGKEKTVYKINIDDNMDLAEEYGIMSIPCVVSFKDGKEYKRSVGLVPKSEIEKLLK